MSTVKKSFWNLPILNSRTNKQKVTLPEMIFGYFLGPLLVPAMTSVVATYYLTFYRTYDGGAFTHQQVSSFFFLGFEIFAHAILIAVLLFLNVEKHIKEEQQLIAERKGELA